MKKQSIKINAILNTIQSLATMIFPVISFGYASKVLGVEALGQYNFAQSIINYFVLVSGLGISTYAIREGARIRNEKSELSAFVGEVFTINVYSTVISMVVLLLMLHYSKYLSPYSKIILILSMQIIAITVGRNWLFTIYEEYFYITIRTIIFQILNMIFLFCFVHSADDINIYAFVSIFGIIGNNAVNIICSKKYCSFGIKRTINKKHIIFRFFAFVIKASLASTRRFASATSVGS